MPLENIFPPIAFSCGVTGSTAEATKLHPGDLHLPAAFHKLAACEEAVCLLNDSGLYSLITQPQGEARPGLNGTS